MSTVLLYLGLGMVTMGLVITLVGLGDKGFKTFQLKLLGPALVCCGGGLGLVRLLVCTVGVERGEVERRGEETGLVEEEVLAVETTEDDKDDCEDFDRDDKEEEFYIFG